MTIHPELIALEQKPTTDRPGSAATNSANQQGYSGE
jgi:hypothetical protein